MTEAGGVWAPGSRELTAALVASVTLVGSETLAIATVMPAVSDELGVVGYGLAFSVFFVGSIVGVLLAGPATDRVGPRRPFLIGMGLFGVGLAVGSLAPAMSVLLAGRGLQGLGAGVIPAVGYACIGRAYCEPARPRMLAVLSTAWVLPGLIGPGLAGFVAAQAGWRWVFGGLLPLVVLTAAAAIRPLGRLEPVEVALAIPGLPAIAGLPVLDTVRFAAGVGLVVAAVDRLLPFGVVALAIAAAIATVGVLCAAGPARRLLPVGWWRARRGVAAAVAVRGLLSYAFLAVDAFVPLVLTDVRGRSVVFASVAVSVSALVWSAGSWAAERLVPRVGTTGLAAAGAALVTVGVGWQMVLLVPAVPIPVGLAGVATAAFGMGLSLTPLSMLVLDQQQEASTGRASSWMALFEQLGFAAGPLLGGLLVAADPVPPGLTRGLAVAFAVAVAVAALATALRPRLLPVAATAVPGPTLPSGR